MKTTNDEKSNTFYDNLIGWLNFVFKYEYVAL